MKKRMMKAVWTFCLTVILLSVCSMTALASGSKGYDVSKMNSYVGKIIIDPNYTYIKEGKSYQPYQKRYFNGSGQCVGFAWARLEEKLNLKKVFSSGEHAKEIPAYAPNGAERESVAGEKYTVKVYTSAKDIKAKLTGNTLVCFKKTNNAAHDGHVVFVEEVLKSGSAKYVYYTEGGGSYYTKGTSGTLKKRELNDFLANSYNGGKAACTGIVVFEPKGTSQAVSITLNKNSLQIKDNACGKLTASVSNAKGSVTWSSSNTAVATVKNGVVTPKKAGTATISASVNWYGTTYQAACKVTVTESKTQISFQSVSGLGTIKKGKDVNLNGTITASGGKIKSVNAVVLGADGRAVLSTGTISVNAKSYKLCKSGLDSALSFKKLAAGKYTLVYTAKAADGAVRMYSTGFSVKAK